MPEGFVFAICMASVSWAGNVLIQTLGHETAAVTQKDARDRELDSLTARVSQLEKNAYDRGCGSER